MAGKKRVGVVGAGVVGLSAATTLLDAGAEVRVYERAEPGGEQSKGRTRVFRLAHGDPALVDLAMRARSLWREWENRFRRRLIGDEGLIMTGDEVVPAWAQAMADAGAPHQMLSVADAAARLPIARLAGNTALFDPSAGPTRARRTVECLTAVCAGVLRREEVVSVEPGAAGPVVVTAQGRWECDEVIVAAGIETGTLVESVGLEIPITVVFDSRFTYPIRPASTDRALPIWFDRSGAYGPGYSSYGQRVGSLPWYAVAVGWDGAENLPPDEESAAHRQKLAEYIPAAYPGLDPEPIDEIRCSYAERGVREDGDGFMARRIDGVTAVYGNNLFKFAPLLGQLLASTALDGQPAPELRAPEDVVSGLSTRQ